MEYSILKIYSYALEKKFETVSKSIILKLSSDWQEIYR